MISIRRLGSPSSITSLQQPHDVTGLLYLMLSDASDLDPFDWIISQIQIGILAVRHKEVSNDLVVDFYVRYFDTVVVLRVTTDGCEHVVNRQHRDPRTDISAKHGISLPTACGAVSKHTSVEARSDPWDEMLSCVLVYLSLRDILEDLVKVVPLLFTTMEDIWSDACQLCPEEHSIKNDQELILSRDDVVLFVCNLFL